MVERFVFGVHRLLLGFILVAMMLLKVGFYRIANFDVAVTGLTSSPVSYPLAGDAQATYLMGSWLGPATMNLLGITGDRSLFFIYSSFSVGFIVAMLIFLYRSLPDRESRLASLLFVTLPVAAVPFHWVGYDSLSLLLFALILVVRNPLLVLLLSVLTGIQHGEMIVIGSLLALAVTRFSLEGESTWLDQRKLLLILIGGLAGRAILELIFRMNGLEVSSRIAEAGNNLNKTIGMWSRTVPIIAVSMLSFMWAMVIFGWRRNVIPKMGTAVSLASALLLTIVVLDQTRVAAVSTLFVVTAVILLNQRLLTAVSPTAALFLLGVWWVTPGLWVWEGQIQTYGSFSFVREVIFGQ